MKQNSDAAVAAQALDKIMVAAQPHLQRLGFLFGNQAKLTLLVQGEGQPGCLILSPHSTNIPNLIKALKEAEAMECVERDLPPPSPEIN